MIMRDPILLENVLYCGAGGDTKGGAEAQLHGIPCCKVLSCINHDALAIASHAANFPDVLHFTEDVRKFDVSPMAENNKFWQAIYPKAKLLLWASLECTNFSKAKGGQPRNADSRTLADDLLRYVIALNPDYIEVENVEEFMSWGPLDKNGRPVSKTAGRDYKRWVRKMKRLGYQYDYQILNCADFGAHTSRKRYFGQFVRIGLPMAFPVPTHSKTAKIGAEGGLLPYRPVKECLDFTAQSQSILTRVQDGKKDLSPMTHRRVYNGALRHIPHRYEKEYYDWVYNQMYYPGVTPHVYIPKELRKQMKHGENPLGFIQKYNSNNPTRPENASASINDPCHTIPAQGNRLALVQPSFLIQRNAGIDNRICSTEDPARTITGTGGNLELVQSSFLAGYYSNGHNTVSTNNACNVLRTKDTCQLVQAYHWIDRSFTGPTNHQPITQPSGSQLGKDHSSLVSATALNFLVRHFSGGGQSASIEDPAGAVLPFPKMDLATFYLMNTNFQNFQGGSVEKPIGTITANRKHFYLINTQWKAIHTSSVEKPMFTIIARLDKVPPYLVEVDEKDGITNLSIAIDPSDNIWMRKIKIFMALNGIVDIKMRMLSVEELKLITGFGKDYILKGSKTNQKKFIGNAVPVIMAKKIIEAIAYANYGDVQEEAA